MKKELLILWIVLATATTFGCSQESAPASKNGEAGADATVNRHPDYENLQGQWKIVSSEWDGEPNEEAVGNLFTFDGTNLRAWIRILGHRSLNYELDPTKEPKHLTAKSGRPPNESVYTAIYELDGDSLKLCFREHDRPTGFKTEVGSFQTSHVLQRTDGNE